jgi:hypothetical protein
VVALGIDFHAYGQLILRPYGWGWEDHPNEALYKKYGDAMRDAIKDKSGKVYTSQKAAGLYLTSGSTDDYITGLGAVGFTIEVSWSTSFVFIPRDRGEFDHATYFCISDSLLPISFGTRADTALFCPRTK